MLAKQKAEKVSKNNKKKLILKTIKIILRFSTVVRYTQGLTTEPRTQRTVKNISKSNAYFYLSFLWLAPIDKETKFKVTVIKYYVINTRIENNGLRKQIRKP